MGDKMCPGSLIANGFSEYSAKPSDIFICLICPQITQ